MSGTVRVIVLNTDEQVAADLRGVLLAIDGVKIVAEIDEPAMLVQALAQFPAEVLLVHLDPNPQGIMDVVAPLIEARKGQIVAIGMTEDRDAELVVRAMRAGMREFLWKPFPPEQLGETLHRVAVESGQASKRLGKLISVISTGGGMGATQMATNVAVELSQIEEWPGAELTGTRPRVAVVDLDFRFGQVAMQLDAQPTYTISELCDTAEQIDTAMLERAMFKHPTGVQVLARPTDFFQPDRISAGQCAGVLAALQEHFDFVVADVPPRFDPSARSVFDMSDHYLLVVQLVVPSVRNADRILNELASSGYAVDRVRIVCNRFGRNAGYLEPGDVELTLKRKFDFYVPDEWKTSAGAVNIGAPLATYAPKSKLRLAYRRIALSLAGVDAAADGSGDASADGRKGLFGFFAGSRS